MKRQIKGFKLDGIVNEIEMPYNTAVFSVSRAAQDVYLWSMVDPEEKHLVKRSFIFYESGYQLDSHGHRFIGTVSGTYGVTLQLFEDTTNSAKIPGDSL